MSPRSNKSRNILYLIDSLAFGGAERQFVELVKGIVEKPSINPFVCYFSKAEEGFTQILSENNIPLDHLKRTHKYDIGPLISLNHYVRNNQIDLIHSFSVLAGLVACILGRLKNVPVVASTIRNAKDYDRVMKYSIKLQAYLADVFIANSYKGFENRFRNLRSNFRVVYNGIDLKRFVVSEKERKEISAKFHFFQFNYIVVMVASLSINKDHFSFIKAAGEIIKHHPDCGFVVIGDGNEKTQLQRLVSELRIEKNFIFTGYTDQVIPILANSNLSVLMTNSKRHEEGIPNALLESMAMGLPVIANKGGGTAEIVNNNFNGYLIASGDYSDLAEKVKLLLKNNMLARAMGGNGKAMVRQKFGYDRYIDEYSKIYESLLS